MKKLFVSVMLLFTLAACGPSNPESVQRWGKQPVAIDQTQSQRITVKRIGVFEDSIAYNDERGIYIIVDNETDVEYVGVSGIGVSELGSHSSGKSRASDER